MADQSTGGKLPITPAHNHNELRQFDPSHPAAAEEEILTLAKRAG
jgi:hypothetical protein